VSRQLFRTLLILAGILPPHTAHALAQDTTAAPQDAFWVAAGLGVGSEDFAGDAGVSYQHGIHLFSFRVAASAGLFDDQFSDIALLYGRATRTARDRYRAGAAIGLAAVDGCVGGSLFGDCQHRRTVVGLPLEAQLAWLPATFLGFGLYGFADFNRTRSFAGVTLSVQLGRVR
jgi:hypothetical protein